VCSGFQPISDEDDVDDDDDSPSMKHVADMQQTTLR
jgi:hypothetical protein